MSRRTGATRLSSTQARLLGGVAAAFGAYPIELRSQVLDVGVELLPGVDAQLAVADRPARGVETVQRLIKTAVFRGSRSENLLGLRIDPPAKRPKTAHARGCRQQAFAEVAVRLKHGFAAGAKPCSVQPERTMKNLFIEGAEKRRQRIVRKRLVDGVEQRAPIPFPPP